MMEIKDNPIEINFINIWIKQIKKYLKVSQNHTKDSEY